MTENPLLSIVIPVLNEAGQIEARLQQLQALRRRGTEVLVVDGGSSDGTAELASPLVDVLLRSEPGRALQMNTGAAAARADWLLFLHLDTRLPASADALLAKLGHSSGAGWGWFDVRLDNPGFAYRLIERCMNLRARLSRVCTGDQTLFVRTSLFRRLGGFPAIPLMEDIAMSKLLRRQARPCVLRPPVITSSRRWEQKGVLTTVLLMWRLRLLYFLGVSPDRLVPSYYPNLAVTGASSRVEWDFPRSRVLVFARAPLRGRVKTRLQASLGEQGCLDLYRALLAHTLSTVQSTGLAPLQLWVDKNPNDEMFTSYCNERDIYLQVEADLGQKMADATARTLAQKDVESVVLIGSDCPAMTVDHLRLALRELESGKDVVITPASDGGYVLLGMRRLYPELFRDIHWGTETVLASTLERIAESGLEFTLLPELWDVDRPDDLQKLAELDARYAQFAAAIR